MWGGGGGGVGSDSTQKLTCSYSLIPTLDMVVIWLNFNPHNFQLSGLTYLLARIFF